MPYRIMPDRRPLTGKRRRRAPSHKKTWATTRREQRYLKEKRAALRHREGRNYGQNEE